MSGSLSVKPGYVNHVHFEQDNRESMVDIYVSTESLRVYDNPSVEDTSPNPSGLSQAQSKMSFVSETSVKRSSFKWACVFMGVVCLLLLAGNIYLAVQKTQDQSIWRSHKMQLEKNNSDYRNLTEQLTIINNKLKEKINTLSSKPSGPPCEVPSHVQAWTQWFDRDDPSGTGDWETIVDLRRENPGKICRDPVDIEAVALSGLDASQTGENIYLNDLENGFVCRNQDQPDWECSDYKVRLSCAPDSCENVCWTKWYNRDDPSGSGDWEHLSALISENPGGDLCAEPVYIEAATVDGEIPAIRTGESFYSYSPTKGFFCRNSDQNTGTCRNYKVRFGCFCRIRMVRKRQAP